MAGAVLRTERLLLRPWRAEDRGAFAAANADPEVRRFFPSVLSRAESDTNADFLASQFDRHEYGPWAVEVPGVTPFAGFCGLWDVVQGPHAPAVEIGWRLAREFWGRGYATEAARAGLAFGFVEAGLPEIVAFVAPGNRPSRNVMDRIGLLEDPDGAFDHPRVADGHWLKRHFLYRLKRAAWTPPGLPAYERLS